MIGKPLTGDPRFTSHSAAPVSSSRARGWLEGLRDFLDPNNAGNFGPGRMRAFLDLPETEPLNSLHGRYPAERVFCLVGTDSRDYGAALGLSRRAAGPLSDGLVQIRNAAVRGAPRAFVHRSHSGHYGLVNSESGYQNLSRFLFGDTRVLVEMADVEVALPRGMAEAAAGKAEVGVAYHIDTVFGVRGLPVELNRRAYSEGSAIFRTYEQLTGHRGAHEALHRLPHAGSPRRAPAQIVGLRAPGRDSGSRL